MKIRVSIVEDSRGTRESLAELLSSADSLQFVGSHASAEEALGKIPAEAPDVVLMDINLPKMSGIECVHYIKQKLPKTQVLMLTTYQDGELLFDSLCKGASGYLLKNLPPADLISAIEQVHAGGAPMSTQIARKLVDHFRQIKQPQSEMARLTKREHEIVVLLAKGLLYREIGEQLGISLSTVRTHLHTVYDKLHVQNRTKAVVKFLGG